MTFKITARRYADDANPEIMTLEDRFAEVFIANGMQTKLPGTVTIEYIGDVPAQLADSQIEAYLGALARYGTDNTLKERG